MALLGAVTAIASLTAPAGAACDPMFDPNCYDDPYADAYYSDPYDDPYYSDPYYSDPYAGDPYYPDPYDDPYYSDPYAGDPYDSDPYTTTPYPGDPSYPGPTDPNAGWNTPVMGPSTSVPPTMPVVTTQTQPIATAPTAGAANWAYSRTDALDEIAPKANVPADSIDAANPDTETAALHRAIAGRLVLAVDALAELGAFGRDEDPSVNQMIAELARTVPSGGLDTAGYLRELDAMSSEFPALVAQLEAEPSETIRYVLAILDADLSGRLANGDRAFVESLPWIDAMADVLMRGGAERATETDEVFTADDAAVRDFVAMFGDPNVFDDVSEIAEPAVEPEPMPSSTTTPDLALIAAATTDGAEDAETDPPIALLGGIGAALLAGVIGLAVALSKRRGGSTGRGHAGRSGSGKSEGRDGSSTEPHDGDPSRGTHSGPPAVTLPIAPAKEEPGSLVELLDASRRMTASLETDEIAAIAVAEARNIVNAEGGMLLRRTADGLVPLASAPSELFSSEDLESSVLRRVVDTGRTVSSVTSGDSALVDVPAAMAAVAIVANGSVIGALMMVRRPMRPFNPSELDALEMLAPLVGSALLAAQTHGSATALADLDALTGLANRRSLDRDIGALRPTHVASYVMIDVDHFKNFNDTNGHAAGDVALQTVARAIAANVRPEDRVYRYGGEEFCVLLPGASAGDAALVAERVRAAVEASTIPGGEHQPGGRVTISIGLADTSPGVGDIIERADSALYAAKESGRNRVNIAGGTSD